MSFKWSMSGTDALKKKLESLKAGLTKAEANQVGIEAKKAIRELISSGESPVRGGGFATRFPGYKNPKRYPGKRKPHSPVNLKLTGKFLRGLSHEVTGTPGGYVVEIFYRGDEALKEEGHRIGWNGQPKRPTLPTGRGERFAEFVQDAYLRVVFEVFRKRSRS